MLVHKGGHTNNVQLITGVRIAEMSQLQNCSVMCTKNGSYCENEKKERKSQGGGGGGGQVGQGGCERRSEAFVKIQKKKLGGGGEGGSLGWAGGWGGGWGGGGGRLVRVDDVNGEVKLVGLGGGGGGGSGWM